MVRLLSMVGAVLFALLSFGARYLLRQHFEDVSSVVCESTSADTSDRQELVFCDSVCDPVASPDGPEAGFEQPGQTASADRPMEASSGGSNDALPSVRTPTSAKTPSVPSKTPQMIVNPFCDK